MSSRRAPTKSSCVLDKGRGGRGKIRGFRFPLSSPNPALTANQPSPTKEKTMGDDFLPSGEPQSGCSRRQFLGGTLGAAASGRCWGPRPAGRRRSGPRRPLRNAKSSWAGRLRRPRKLDRQLFQAARRLRIARRGRLLPGRGRPLRRRLGRGQGAGGSPAFRATRR